MRKPGFHVDQEKNGLSIFFWKFRFIEVFNPALFMFFIFAISSGKDDIYTLPSNLHSIFSGEAYLQYGISGFLGKIFVIGFLPFFALLAFLLAKNSLSYTEMTIDEKKLNAYTFPQSWFVKKKYGITLMLENVKYAEIFCHTEFSRSATTFYSVILQLKDGDKKVLPFVFFGEDEPYASRTALYINDFLRQQKRSNKAKKKGKI